MKGFFFLLVCLPATFAGMAFPVGTERDVQDIFRDVNPSIRWDSTNFLVDEAGPYADCSYVGTRGLISLTKLTDKYLQAHGVMESVAGLTDDTRMTGRTLSGARKDIITITKSWVRKSPFFEQIKEAHKFGCSVLPSCGDRTVVTCIFTPAYQGQGDQGGQNGGGVNSGAVAFTGEQYILTEGMFQKQNRVTKWDRSYFLENLSGTETSCAMIGRRQWNYQKAQKTARKYKKGSIGLLFGWANRSGNTDRDVENITGQWLRTDEGRKQISRAKNVGCSLIQECGNGQTVVSCIVTPGA
ncbi:uncharacterized protein LOC135488123 [Lineus longissimus]|uniref:uncharacterized protein LOC135488123 n=1 Tax=Lineus longissimus TaxID=88925 RepID=UPI002B4F663C